MATIDLSKCTPEQRTSYNRMMRGAGKGDSPRNIWSAAFRSNYDRINWQPSRKHYSYAPTPKEA